MEMLPPAPVPSNVVVGATVVKRFPGYGERRGTIAEIDLDGGKVIVRWPTDERTDPSHTPTATTSKFWGVNWDKQNRRWKAGYTDANGKTRTIGYYDTQEQAAHAVNAAIRRAGLEGKRRTNPVVDGQLVPKSGPRGGRIPKRRREEPAATPSRRSPRRR
jgi:hypothetical protein